MARTSGLSQSVRVVFLFFLLFFSLILFHVMDLVLRRRNGSEKKTLLLLSLFCPTGVQVNTMKTLKTATPSMQKVKAHGLYP